MSWPQTGFACVLIKLVACCTSTCLQVLCAVSCHGFDNDNSWLYTLLLLSSSCAHVASWTYWHGICKLHLLHSGTWWSSLLVDGRVGARACSIIVGVWATLIKTYWQGYRSFSVLQQWMICLYVPQAVGECRCWREACPVLLLWKLAVCSQCILRAEFVQYMLIGAGTGHAQDPIPGEAVMSAWAMDCLSLEWVAAARFTQMQCVMMCEEELLCNGVVSAVWQLLCHHTAVTATLNFLATLILVLFVSTAVWTYKVLHMCLLLAHKYTDRSTSEAGAIRG